MWGVIDRQASCRSVVLVVADRPAARGRLAQANAALTGAGRGRVERKTLAEAKPSLFLSRGGTSHAVQS